MSETCKPHHDWFTATLTFGLCCGLVISYVPQHYRIISSRSSEGLSPLFLFLGVTSASSGMLNMVTMQWGIIRCCQFFSFGSCVEMTAGVIQVGLQWAMFSLIMILYMIYYPPHLKFLRDDSETFESEDSRMIVTKSRKKAREWQFSIVLSWFAVIHFLVAFLTTLFLLMTFPPPLSPSPSPDPTPFPLPSDPNTPNSSKPVAQWATFLGVSSAILAATQYFPQIVHTYHSRLVGALSIPMMCIQTPGAVLMVLSIALRPGTNWTSWITFAVAGVCQGILLVMCIFWKIRQKRLGIDDFGQLLSSRRDTDMLSIASSGRDSGIGSLYGEEGAEGVEEVPGLQVDQDEDAVAMSKALASALDAAVGEDVRSGGVREVPPIAVSPSARMGSGSGQDETTPLLGQVTHGERDGKKKESSVRWFGWFM